MDLTVLVPGSEAVVVDASIADGQVLVGADGVEAATGMTLTREGLCEGAVCTVYANDGEVDLAEAGLRLGQRSILDAEAAVMALAVPQRSRASAIDDLIAPGFTLPDLDGNDRSLEEFRGRKQLLVAFASW
ncbi:MAG: hypothetical protein IH940_08525 [Acidobacteria bacterium]|nr:hypothetical protein [Acidobacteriota bacterium]